METDNKNKKRKKRTHDDFVKEIEELHPNEYEVLSKFCGMLNKVKIRHKICNHVWDVRARNILYVIKSCPYCKHSKIADSCRLRIDDIRIFIEKEGYLLLSNEYQNAKTKLTLQCPIGHEFTMNYNNFHSGQRCPTCAIIRNTEKQRLSVEDIENQITERGFKLISWEEEYKNTQSKFTLECSNGHVTTKSVSSFLQGCDCPKCNKISKGEETILNFLEQNNIPYEYQFEIEDCKNKRALPFDFAIFNNDNTLRLLIEYDGEQHFKPIERFGGVEKFNKNKINDKIKDDYCKNNNINLIRIPYTKLNNLGDVLESIFSLV